MNIAIQVSKLEKSYDSNSVLKGITFDVKKGEIFALLGVNGAGKTTTLECIEGLRKYDSGNISTIGKVGIQLQSSSLPKHIKAMEALELFARWNKTKIDHTMLTALGIGELAKKQYFQLSTGQKRRLHLALSLVNNPDIVFLDEPTAGLDVEGRISLHGQIRKLKEKGKTVILASHDMAEVEMLCDRIAILRSGKISFIGTIAELNAQVGKYYSIEVETSSGKETLETDNIGNTLLELLEGYKQNNTEIMDIKISRGSLEQHFMELARRDS